MDEDVLRSEISQPPRDYPVNFRFHEVPRVIRSTARESTGWSRDQREENGEGEAGCDGDRLGR